jgi:hypothetical protein
MKTAAFRDLFESARHRPDLCFDGRRRYDVMVAFVMGCDAGTAWVLLRGFDDWIAARHPDVAGDPWPSAVARIALASTPSAASPATATTTTTPAPAVQAFDDTQHRHAVATLWRLLDQFLS